MRLMHFQSKQPQITFFLFIRYINDRIFGFIKFDICFFHNKTKRKSHLFTFLYLFLSILLHHWKKLHPMFIMFTIYNLPRQFISKCYMLYISYYISQHILVARKSFNVLLGLVQHNIS